MYATKDIAVEKVVALVPDKHNEEIALSRSVTAIELEAESIVIETDEDYSAAAEFGRKVKRAAAEVTEFFKPMKDDAHRAHKTICDREKAMLTPLTNAEKVLKNTIGGYSLRKERERKAAEEAARRAAQEEANRRLAEAAEQEKAGNAEAAESAMLDAQMADSMSHNITVPLSCRHRMSPGFSRKARKTRCSMGARRIFQTVYVPGAASSTMKQTMAPVVRAIIATAPMPKGARTSRRSKVATSTRLRNDEPNKNRLVRRLVEPRDRLPARLPLLLCAQSGEAVHCKRAA
jgi:ribosomal protein S17E